MGGRKPYLLSAYRNNLGKEVTLCYRSSAAFYLDDRRECRPWRSKLPFPVHCVARVETREAVSGHQFVTTYRYHHGHYDHPEREFRGFGMVERTDAETFDRFAQSGASNVTPQPLHQPPV